MYVAALEMDLLINDSTSLKHKRSVMRHIIAISKRRYGVSVSEVDHQGTWQRAGLGFSVVASSAGHAESTLDTVERFVWSHPEISVLASERHWLDLDP